MNLLAGLQLLPPFVEFDLSFRIAFQYGGPFLEFRLFFLGFDLGGHRRDLRLLRFTAEFLQTNKIAGFCLFFFRRRYFSGPV